VILEFLDGWAIEGWPRLNQRVSSYQTKLKSEAKAGFRNALPFLVISYGNKYFYF
jgi:hypothetical protein